MTIFSVVPRTSYMAMLARFRDHVPLEKTLCCSDPSETWAYFISNRWSGFTLEDEGAYLSGVFSYGPPHAMHFIVAKASEVAKAMGHKDLRLDCYEPLVRLYAAQGFEEMSSDPFESKPIPAGWQQSMGKPTIHHMIKHLP